MKFITEEALDIVNADYCDDGIKYYYHLEEVIGQIKLMDNIKTTLELGPYKSPIVVGGDVLDITDDYLEDYPVKIGKFYKHNGSETPYPFKDKKYDLVIACQVLEHLGTNQIEVFKELCRISKKAIITLPYKWNTPCDMHHMINRGIIDDWANGLKPVFEKIISKPFPHRSRILRIYNFDDMNNLEYNKKIQEYADFQISNKLVKEQYKVQELEKRINILKKENDKLFKTNRNRELLNNELMEQLNEKTNEMAEYLTTLGYLKYKSKNIAFRIKNRISN